MTGPPRLLLFEQVNPIEEAQEIEPGAGPEAGKDQSELFPKRTLQATTAAPTEPTAGQNRRRHVEAHERCPPEPAHRTIKRTIARLLQRQLVVDDGRPEQPGGHALGKPRDLPRPPRRATAGQSSQEQRNANEGESAQYSDDNPHNEGNYRDRIVIGGLIRGRPDGAAYCECNAYTRYQQEEFQDA